MARAVRVSGCSGPRTRSRTGSSAAYWSRAPAGSPASPVQRARLARAVRVSGCSGPRTRSTHGQQRGELVAGPGRIPRLPGPAGEVAAGGQGVRVLRAEDPLDARAAARRTGPGRRPRPPPPRSRGRGWRGRSGCPGAPGRGPARARAAARRTGPGPRPDPPPPRSSGRGCRGRSGCPGAPGRGPARRTGSSAAYWSRAPAGSPASPGPAGEVGAGGQGVRVLRAEDPLAARAAARRTGPGRRPRPPPPRSSGRGWRARVRVSGCSGPRTRSPHGQQRGVLVPGPGRVPRLPGPAGEVAAGGQGVRVLRAETRSSTGSSAANWSRAPAASPASPVQRARLARAVRVSGCSGPRTRSRDGQQRGELVPGPGRVPRLPGPAGEVGAGGQGVRVLRAEDPFPSVKHLLLKVAGGRVTAALPEIAGDSAMPSLSAARAAWACGSSAAYTGQVSGCGGVVGDRGLDQGGGGLPPCLASSAGI